MQTLESEKVQNKDIIVWGLTNSGAILLTRGDFATSSDFKIDCSGIRRRAFLHFIFQVANNGKADIALAYECCSISTPPPVRPPGWMDGFYLF